jgi:hypothetical protein
MKRAAVKLTLGLSLLAGILSVAVPSQAAPGCKKDKDSGCIQVYDPVICDHGKIYSNSCFAALDCATNCVPYTPPAQ